MFLKTLDLALLLPLLQIKVSDSRDVLNEARRGEGRRRGRRGEKEGEAFGVGDAEEGDASFT
jgi:hypothetical protein